MTAALYIVSGLAAFFAARYVEKHIEPWRIAQNARGSRHADKIAAVAIIVAFFVALIVTANLFLWLE